MRKAAQGQCTSQCSKRPPRTVRAVAHGAEHDLLQPVLSQGAAPLSTESCLALSSFSFGVSSQRTQTLRLLSSCASLSASASSEPLPPLRSTLPALPHCYPRRHHRRPVSPSHRHLNLGPSQADRANRPSRGSSDVGCIAVTGWGDCQRRRPAQAPAGGPSN